MYYDPADRDTSLGACSIYTTEAASEKSIGAVSSHPIEHGVIPNGPV